MKPIVKVENLSKQYRIGAQEVSYQTLRDALAGVVRNPLGRLRRRAQSPVVWALEGINFEVQPGEVLGLVGSNGAGKSTLLKILSRIVEPTTGRADLYGRVGSLLEVGTGFHPELTGRENTFLNGAMLGMKRAEITRKFDEIVAFSEIERFIDTPVKHYSSGMYTRLAFAVAAHLEPEILIVDEVLAVGDAAFQKKCIGKMGDVARAGRTVLFVSHNMTAVRSLCERVLWLDKGRIIEDGDADRIIPIYTQRGTVVALEQLWEDPSTAPGNEKVRIRSANVKPLTGDGNGEMTIETPLQVEFEFWNYVPEAVLNFTMHLYTVEGSYVFATASEVEPRPRGLLRQVVKIPANFLNDGAYSVAIQIVEDTSNTLCYQADILVFEVSEAPRSGSWFGKWPGIIRPKLEWVSESVTADEDIYEYERE
ncbi:MAG: ABC transporter ATP-binding protein [Acidobacteria bacterium]|nr:ABC transporter ATP-binding protein [Acidobacteriota bacterium]MCA1640413.1 ABC transporter ATP-binding protein [Acidobacteriota bacterium]